MLTSRLMAHRDGNAILRFAGPIAPRTVLILNRDIRNPKGVAACEDHMDQGLIASILPSYHGQVCSCTSLVRDDLSWSPHGAEIGVETIADLRGSGLDRKLAQKGLLHEHVRDPEGTTQDIVVLSSDLAKKCARHTTFGFEHAA